MGLYGSTCLNDTILCYISAETGDAWHSCTICQVPVWVWQLQWSGWVPVLCASPSK